MNSEIIWYQNTKQLLFKELPYEDFDHLFKSINSFYQSIATINTRLWYDFKYLNSVLNLYFINFSKFKNPRPVFFALLFKYIAKGTIKSRTSSEEFFNKFCSLDRSYSLGNIRTSVNYYLVQNEFIPNDLGIIDSDFNLFNDILLSNTPVEVAPNVLSGVYFGYDEGLSFKFKR